MGVAPTPKDLDCAGAAPTPKDLVARLQAVTGTRTIEQLARALDVPVRSVTNWNSGKGVRFDTALELLHRAGWLVTDEEADDRAAVARARLLAERFEREARELREALG